MKAVVQRVTSASVTLKATGETRRIGPGLAVLLGVAAADRPAGADWLAEKLSGLRIFEDAAGKMNLGVSELPGGGEMLVVSQFTLLGDSRKGRRPSFAAAAPPAQARPLYEAFLAAVRQRGIAVQTGEFGADMTVCIVNDGPVTLVVETPALRPFAELPSAPEFSLGRGHSEETA